MKTKLSKIFLTLFAIFLVVTNLLTVSAASFEDVNHPNNTMLVFKGQYTERLDNGDYALIEDYEEPVIETRGLITHRVTKYRNLTIYSNVNGTKQYHVKFTLEGQFKYTGSFSECEAAYCKAVKYSNKYRTTTSARRDGDSAIGNCTWINNNTGKSNSRRLEITVDAKGNVTYN